MATIDQLMAAFGAFGQAAKEYGATKGIEDATNAVTELKKNTEMSLQERLAAQSQITNQLQAGLAGLGAPQTQIAAAVGALAPPKVETSADALRMAQSTSNPEDAKQYAQLANTFATAEGKLKATAQQDVIDQETKALGKRELDKRYAEALYREGKVLPVSEVQKAVDIDFAKNIQKTTQELRTQQGIVAGLNDAAGYFEREKGSGAILNRGPLGRAFGTERTKNIDKIKKSILPNIKKYFPGATSNVELEETLKSEGINEGLSDKDIAENARALQMLIQSDIQAEQNRLKFFKQNRTLEGFEDPLDTAMLSPEGFKERLETFKAQVRSSGMRQDKSEKDVRVNFNSKEKAPVPQVDPEYLKKLQQRAKGM